jgi:large subunit ribosomal protein L28
VAYQCDICGKTKQFGHNVSPSERKTNRAWKPNLQVKRFQIGSNKVKMKVCTQCLRTLKKQEATSENSNQKPEASKTPSS